MAQNSEYKELLLNRKKEIEKIINSLKNELKGVNSCDIKEDGDFAACSTNSENNYLIYKKQLQELKEIEEALLRGEADIAVHSMKDVPAVLPQGLEVNIVPKRETPFDCFVSEKYLDLMSLPENSVVGTSSLRREAQLKKIRKDIQIKMLRGNLDTRIRKLKQGEYDAIIVAMAGIKRLGITAKNIKVLSPPLFLPAVRQGALGIEYCSDNKEIIDAISFLDHFESKTCVEAERAFLHELEGGCQVPLGAYAVLKNNTLYLRGFVSHPLGEPFISSEKKGHITQAQQIGRELARQILANGGREILNTIFSK